MKANKLLKNYIYNSTYQILLMILPLVTSPYISRVLGANSIGIYSYTYSIVFYFGLFANLGISTYGNREIARCRDDQKQLNRCFSSIFLLHVLLSFIAIICYLAFVFVAESEYRTIALIQLIYLVSVLFDISWFFFGIEEFKITVGINALIKVATTILIFVFVRDKGDLWKYTLILTFGNAFGNLSLWMFFKKYAKIVKVSIPESMVHLKPMALLAISSIAVSVYLYIDKIMLGKMSSMDQVGYYENAFKMVQFPLGLITAMGTVMLPHISRVISKSGVGGAKSYINSAMKIIALLSPAITFGLISVADEFSVIFWGKDFRACAPILAILTITAILISWNNIIRTSYLIPMQKDQVYVKAVCSGAAVDVVLNVILIPKLGGVGASVGTVGAYMTVFIVQNIAASKELPILSYGRYFVPYCVIGAIMFGVVRMLSNFLLFGLAELIIMILVGAFVYIMLSLIYICHSKDAFYYSCINKILRREPHDYEADER